MTKCEAMSAENTENLILTDNMIEAEDMSQILEELGWGLSFVGRSGSAGLDALKREREWKLVVFGLTGFNSGLEQCIDMVAARGIPAIFINGSGIEWRHSDFVGITRPFIPEDVEAALTQLSVQITNSSS